MVSFPSSFWREKETKETHNHILFVWERGRERKKSVTSFVESCSKMERGESAEHLLDDPDPHCYKKPLEVAPLSWRTAFAYW